jgi:hypothetical protein
MIHGTLGGGLEFAVFDFSAVGRIGGRFEHDETPKQMSKERHRSLARE